MRIEGPPYHSLLRGRVVAHRSREDGTSTGEIDALVVAISDDEPLIGVRPLGTVGGGGLTTPDGTTKARGLYAVPPIGAAVGIFCHGGDPENAYYIAGWWGEPGGNVETPDHGLGGGVPRGDPDIVVWELERWKIIISDKATPTKFRVESKEDPDLFFEIDVDTKTLTARSSKLVRIEAKGSPDAFVELDGSSGKITIQGTDVRLGDAAAAEALVLGNVFLTLFNTHKHLGVTVGGGVTGFPDPGTLMVAATHLSSKVKTA